MEAVALCADRAELKAEYPGLTDADIEKTLRFAAMSVPCENATRLTLHL